MRLTLIAIVVLLGVASATMIPQIYPNSWSPKNYRYQLNDPPKQAWAHIIKDYDKEIQMVERVFRYLDWHTEEELRAISDWGRTWAAHPEIAQEAEAIAELAQVSFDVLFFLQFTYEFSTYRKACSSVVVRNGNEQVIHGRNMDFPGWNLFGALSGTIEYYRGNEHIYTCAQYVGAVFCLTGIKPGKFAITVDTRHDPEFGQWKDVVKALKEDGAPSASMWVSTVLKEANTYQEALDLLSKTEVSAPIYYIISGVKPNEGAIIEKEINGTNEIIYLTEKDWYIVQTNYDHDKEEPVYDQRRHPVEKHLNKMGNSTFTAHTMYNQVLTKWPTLNIATVISIVFIPANGYIDLTVWHGGYERNRTRPHGNSVISDSDMDILAQEMAQQFIEQDALVNLSEGQTSIPSLKEMMRFFVDYKVNTKKDEKFLN